jgi:hypothetical protein
MVAGANTFSATRLNQVARIIARGEYLCQRRKKGSRRTILLARRTEDGMEPDALLCSRNARSRTPLVGRAQWKISQPPSLEREQASLEGDTYRSMRAVKSSLGHSSKERHGGGSPGCHSDVKTTMMYIHVLNRGPGGVRSPLDGF